MTVVEKKRILSVAIDGPSGVGKSTVSKLLAERLGFKYVDTGAMYRAVALGARDSGVDLGNDRALEEYCSTARIEFDSKGERISLNGKDYTTAIRLPETGEVASRVSARPPVRTALVAMQRQMAEGGRVVMEGRDIGTVVLPDAPVKFYLDARPDVRARRRHGDFTVAGAGVDVGNVANDMAERDRRDKTRPHSPLKPADDAIIIDTSDVSIEEVVASMMKLTIERF